MIFTGTFQRSLDGKQRVMLPKQMRSAFQQPEDTERPLFLTPGTDSCLELHTPESLEELAQQARQNNAGTQNIRAFSRLFYARAHRCEIDKQGRIRIPRELMDLAGLNKELVFVGVGFHWEIWDQASWDAFLESNNDQFDQIVQTTFDPVSTASAKDTNSETPTYSMTPKGPSPK